MVRKITLIISISVLTGVILLVGSTSLAKPADSSPAWKGSWQIGPSLDTTPLGCTAGDGFARFTGLYYPEQDRVYFLGGRCEDASTTGRVFFLNPQDRSYYLRTEIMDTPVSNYQVVRIDDDGFGYGPGLYIVGGRTNSGVHTNDVQVYYPNVDLAQVITTDPFPPSVAYTPGGVVSSGIKIYAFGGYDGVNMSPAFFTYVPAALPGNRWIFSPGLSLPTPRTYISAVLIEHKIYAIGGDELVGGTLSPITDTLVLDLENIAAGWQDDLMADLPQPIGDASAVYVAENALNSGIYLIGGLWPDPVRTVYRYDLASDTWETFPDLVIPAPATGLRNHAAVYIPSSSSGTGAGIPGLWVFGGYDGSITNAMTSTSEFFDNPLANIFLPLVRR